MSDTIIKVENLGKMYRLGQVGTGTISHDLNRWWHRVRGKEDPYLMIGEINDRSKKGRSDLVWALKDINFEVKRGEVLGIVGKNGAGKSTLLKILSQVTAPTVGDIKVKGRIASLLEVGTGFHPDLTGRENVFLNGAILGMTKREISTKFDEIVSFSGVERYIDTPVKRYSSGMYVRLAFAVAAHLESEILIVDEVLAVGDADFQKKCLGKMKDVSGQGRTVLFVSHNMAAVKQLCTKGLLLKNGKVESEDVIEKVIAQYNSFVKFRTSTDLDSVPRSGLGAAKFTGIEVLSGARDGVIKSGSKLLFRMYYKTNELSDSNFYEFAVGAWNSSGTPVFMLTNSYIDKEIKLSNTEGFIDYAIEKLPLNKGIYSINLLLKRNGIDMDFIEDAYSFEVANGNYYDSNMYYPEHYEGSYCDFSIQM